MDFQALDKRLKRRFLPVVSNPGIVARVVNPVQRFKIPCFANCHKEFERLLAIAKVRRPVKVIVVWGALIRGCNSLYALERKGNESLPLLRLTGLFHGPTDKHGTAGIVVDSVDIFHKKFRHKMTRPGEIFVEVAALVSFAHQDC